MAEKILPSQGSKFWGATLNQYLREMQNEITSLSSMLNNFTVTASYDGSGFITGTYSVEERDGSTSVSSYSSVDVKKNYNLKFSGKVYFAPTDSDTSGAIIDFTSSDNMKALYFTNSTVDNDGQARYCQLAKGGTVYSFNTTDLLTLLSSDKTNGKGYYPLYIKRETSENSSNAGDGFTFILNLDKKYLYRTDCILIGVFEYLGSTIKFIPRADDASKSIYETRRDTFTTSIQLTSQIYSNNNSSDITFASSMSYILMSNGVNPTATTTDSNITSITSYDQLKVAATTYYIVVPDTDGGVTDAEIKGSVNMLSSAAGTLTGKMYGVYATISGALIFEQKTPSSTSSLSSYTWELANDNTFECGNLVFIGALVYTTENTWRWYAASTGGISPAKVLDSQLETTKLLPIDDTILLLGGDNLSDASNVLQYEIGLKESPIVEGGTGKYLLELDTSIKGSNTTTGYDGVYTIPVFSPDFYIYDNANNVISLKTSDGTFFSVSSEGLKVDKIMRTDKDNNTAVLTLDYATVSLGAITATGNISTSGGISGKNAAFSGTLKADGDATLSGNVTIADGKSVSLTNGLTLTNTSNDGIILTSKRKVTIDNSSSAIAMTSSSFALTSSGDLAISGKNITVSSSNEIQVGNNLYFTSDCRYKKDIKKVDYNKLYDAVKSIDIDTYKYLDSEKEYIGLIAQELEEALPEYKDLFISLNDDGVNKDKRTVAEIKLIFLVWGALKKLIEKVEER